MTVGLQFYEEMIKESSLVQQKLLRGMEAMLSIDRVDSGVTPFEVVYLEDKVKVLHYAPKGAPATTVPLLVSYALVNRQYMMDIQEDRSLFRRFMDMGLDLYVIDWGYPSKMDKFLTMEDYLLGYLDNVVEMVKQRAGTRQINLLGVCQGGTNAIIYSSLFPEKIKNLVAMVAPVDFHATHKGLLNLWSNYMDVDLMVDVFGNIPGEFMNLGFLWLKPFQLIIDKYVGLLDNIDNPAAMKNFLRMESWIFDSPDQAGETFRQFCKEMYQQNRLVKGEFTLGGRRVDLKNLTMPILNIFGEEDHLVPPECSRPLSELVGSSDVTTLGFPLGHIGMYVSSRAQKDIAPTVVNWLIDRSNR